MVLILNSIYWLGRQKIKEASGYSRNPLFDINVFKYVSLLQIDFDLKFSVINFQTIPR